MLVHTRTFSPIPLLLAPYNLDFSNSLLLISLILLFCKILCSITKGVAKK